MRGLLNKENRAADILSIHIYIYVIPSHLGSWSTAIIWNLTKVNLNLSFSSRKNRTTFKITADIKCVKVNESGNETANMSQNH